MNSQEERVAISKVAKKRHGETVIRKNAPYKVVEETITHVQIEHRNGLCLFLLQEEVCLLTIKC